MEMFSNDTKNNTTIKRYLEFMLGEESYAVELLKVKEVLTPPELTAIPKAPSYVLGLMNLRGLVLTVIDLRKKMGITPKNDINQNAVIIFDLEDRYVGVLVDSIQKVLNVSVENIKPIPDEEANSSKHLMGILDHESKLTMWVDPHTLLESSAQINLKAA